MGMNKVLAAAALATTGAFGVTEAEAGGVQWSVTVGSPFYAPAPVYIPPPPASASVTPNAPVVASAAAARTLFMPMRMSPSLSATVGR